MRKKRATRRRRRRSPSASDDGQESDEDNTTRKKRQKKEKEQVQYKSAQFIEDSDEEYGGMDAFLEKEKAQREKAALAAAMGGANPERPIGMRATGTKKRKRRNKKAEDAGNLSASAEANIGGAGRNPRSSPSDSPSISDKNDSDSASNSSEGSESGDRDDDGLVDAAPHAAAKEGGVSGEGAPVTGKPRPKPRPVPRRTKGAGIRSSSRTPVSLDDRDRRRSPQGGRPSGQEGGDSGANEHPPRVASPLGDDEVSVKAARRAKRMVLDDSDEE